MAASLQPHGAPLNGPTVSIQNTVVQTIELQGNRGGTGKSRQNSSDTGIAKFAGATPLTTVQLIVNTGVAPFNGMPPAKVMSSWSGGTGIVKFSGADRLKYYSSVECHSTANSTAKVVPPRRHHFS